MKFTIITPTHDTKFISELEESLLTQTYPNWEWVVLLNNGATYDFKKDKRIKTFNYEGDTNFVGRLKKAACSYATGDVIVEVDHDDILTPNCLDELYKVYSKHPDIGFVYSDDAKLSDSFKPYNPAYGWSYRMYDYKGKQLYAMKTQPLYPGRFGYIWFAPDHVRSWRKDVYDKVGGHNENMKICDDLDLMHRLYMVTKFHHIPAVLYIYRIHGENSWLRFNSEIQALTVSIFNNNIYKLAERFAEVNNLLKIDLCGGHNKPQGYISIDKYNGDIVYDLDKGIPLGDNTCGVVRAHDALEHLVDKHLTMKEIHRVLAPGGILLSETPSTDGRGAFQDPTHVSFWNQNSFWYYTKPELMNFINNKTIRFRECRLETRFLSEHLKNNNISHVTAYLEALK
jgi:O-antigen biosynthesis protein